MESHSDRDHFDELFRHKLADYQSPAAPPAWEEIACRLEKPRTRTHYMRYAAAFTALVATTCFLCYELTQLHENVVQPEMSAYDPTALYKSDSELKQQPLPAAIDEMVKKEEIKKEKTTIKTYAAPKQSKVLNIAKESSTSESKEVPSKQKVNEQQQQQSHTTEHKDYYSLVPQNKAAVIKREKKTKHRRKRMNLALLASNSPASSKSSFLDSRSKALSNDDLPFLEINGYSRSQFDPSKLSGYNHRIPLRFTLSAAWQFAPRWSLSSGVVYSNLASDFDLMGTLNVTGEQKQHYIGIPLFINFDIIDYKGLRLYAGLGGEVNFNVNTNIQYATISNTKEHSYADKKPVYALGGKLGLGYAFLRSFEFFVEPDVMHFSTASKVRSYWTDNPMVFSLNLGLRTMF